MNIFDVFKGDVNKIFSMTKTLKLNMSLDLSCDISNKLLSDDNIMSLVKAVEEKLQVDSSDEINKSMKNEDLKTAAEMFMYLSLCPDSRWFKSWFTFYKDLFLTQSADKIILTLNRMMKTKTSKDNAGKNRAEKLIRKTKNLLSLKFEEIQSLLPGKETKNESLQYMKIPYGKNYSLKC